MFFEDVRNQLYTHYLQQGWTEHTFARQMGMSMQRMHKMWSCPEYFTLSLVQKMATALNLKVDIRIDDRTT